MSDKQIEMAQWIRGDVSLPLPWQAPNGLEFLYAQEEQGEIEDRRSDAQEMVLCYCFADTRPEDWRTVAARAHALMRTLWPAMIARRSHHELLEVREHERPLRSFPLGEFARRLAEEEMVETMGTVMEYYFPDGRQWLRDGTRNLYLVARLYQPGLVTPWKADLTYEEMAGVFEELPARPLGEGHEWIPKGWTANEWERAAARARARWSARANGLITRKLAEIGARKPAMYGKGPKASAAYRAAAMGNANRKRKGGR
jgi:hypothetical protein